MSIQFFGVKIVLRDKASPVTENTAIGLYNVAGDNSEFRWIQNSSGNIDGIPWKEGIFIGNGMSPFSKIADITRGGNTSSPGSAGVVIRNYLPDGNVFSTYCAANGIYLNGCIAKIYLITDNVSDQKWYGVCEYPTWDNVKYSIPFRGNLNKRVSNLTKIISAANRPNATGDTIGKSIPVTFGKNYGNNLDILALQTGNLIQKLNIINLQTPLGDASPYTAVTDAAGDFGMDSFPCVKLSVPHVYYPQANLLRVSIGTVVSWYNNGVLIPSGTFDLTSYFSDSWYIKIDTGGDSAGSYRKITSIHFDATLPYLDIEFSPYLTSKLFASPYITDDDQTWVSVVKIKAQYEIDIWTSLGLLDNNGILTDVFGTSWKVHNSGLLENIPANTINPSISSIINLNPGAYEGDPFSINDFMYIPCPSIRVCNLPDLSYYLTNGVSQKKLTSSGSDPGPGIFTKETTSAGAIQSSVPNVSSHADLSFVGDRQSTRSIDMGFSSIRTFPLTSGITQTIQYTICLEILPPQIPSGIKFDSLYLGISAVMKETATTVPAPGISPLIVIGSPIHLISLKYRNRIGKQLDAQNNILPFPDGNTDYTVSGNSLDQSLTIGAELNDFPNNYFLDTVTSPDQYMYPKFRTSNIQAGYQYYPLTGIDKDSYSKIACFGILAYNEHQIYSAIPDTYGLFTHDFFIKQAALFLKRQVSIKNSIYVQFAGRIYNDTWDSRKISANCIESPVDILEHIIRLQNWSENATPPATGWGTDYIASGVSINETSFDSVDTELLTVKNFKAAAQFNNYDDCYSDKLKKSLCRNFFLLNYQDRNGQECVVRATPPNIAPVDTIQLKHIVDRRDIEIEEPNPADMFPELFVRYNKNNATGEYQSTIRINNAGADAYTDGFVEGMESSEAEYYWGLCHDLWLKSGNTEKPSSDLTDLDWANGADADIIAKEYLQKMILWMGYPKITFKVHLSTILALSVWPEEGFKFNLQLPFHTGNVSIICELSEIEFDPNTPHYVTISAYMFYSAANIPEDFNIVETLQTLGANDTWIESLMAQSGNNNILEVN